MTEIRIRVVPDDDAESPRAWDNVGTMVCWHRRYQLGDEQPKLHPNEWRRRLADQLVGGFGHDDVADEHVEQAVDKHVCSMLPLYLYDHSGITMSTGSFSCRFDSGPVGWIYCTWERARKEWTGTDAEIVALATACLESEVQVYDQYLRGDVYGFIIEQIRMGGWDQIDSCWGFWGHDPEQNGMTEHWDEDVAEHFRQHGVERGR